MQTESSVEIDRPIDEVFDYTIHNVAEWSTIVVEDEVIEETPQVVGTRFRVVTEDRGHRMTFDGVVTHHEPNRAHTVEMTGKQFDIRADYRFEDLGGRTRLTQVSTVEGKGFVKVMFFLLGWLMRRANCRALEKEHANLKRILEERAAPAS